MTHHYADRLADRIRETGTPALVGLDPRWDQLPGPIREAAGRHRGTEPQQRAHAFEAFCREIIDVVAELVPAVKPQAAFFEQLGPEGVAALRNVMLHARRAGLIVIADVKRGDIGSTAEAYARAYLAGTDPDAAPFPADALTVNPYLGTDTLEPFVRTAAERAGGVYVLVRTSNPGARTLQDLVADGRAVFHHVAEHVERLAEQTAGASGYGIVGAVVGATYPRELAELRGELKHAPLLVPGYGAQGAGAEDVRGAFDARGQGALINSSRAINFAFAREPYASRFGPQRWQDAVRVATQDMIEELRKVLASDERTRSQPPVGQRKEA